MKGFTYQLKNIRRDKLCLLSFLLPIIAGLAISMLSEVSFSSMGETAFYVLENNLSDDATQWLPENGSITTFPDRVSLESAVNNPSTQGIGVLQDGNKIKTLLSGDEFQVNKVIGNTLPDLYAKRSQVDSSAITIIPTENSGDILTSLLVVITMITAMFMGCTFNAMSMIGEKEDGISLINEILPMKKTEYVIQKIALGFIGGLLSSILTALVCMNITASQAIPLLILIVLSAFVAALVGLFIGHFSNGLMVGIINIKVVMILFLAPPILFYLAVPSNSLPYVLSYVFPSTATFYGLMDLLIGQTERLPVSIILLFAHSLTWLMLFIIIKRRK